MPWINSSERLPEGFERIVNSKDWDLRWTEFFVKDKEGGKYTLHPARTLSGEYKWEDSECQYHEIDGTFWLDETISEESNKNELWVELFNAIKSNIKYALPAQDLANDFRKNYLIIRK